MGYIFIRYAKQDKEFAEKLATELRKNGIQIWQGLHAIRAGEDWGKAMQRAIIQADAMIFLSSQSSANSNLIHSEINTAINNKITVIPVVLDFPGFKFMPKTLYGINWIDFRKDYDSTLTELINRIPANARGSGEVTAPNNQSRGYIFISYAEEDTPFVITLREFFETKGYGYWDYQESDRDYHGQLHLELEDVIREASATLSILSPDWKSSKWTAREYLFSEQVGTPIFLLQAREMEPTLLTAGVPYIDFVENKEIGFERLEAELKRKGLL